MRVCTPVAISPTTFSWILRPVSVVHDGVAHAELVSIEIFVPPDAAVIVTAAKTVLKIKTPPTTKERAAIPREDFFKIFLKLSRREGLVATCVS